MLGETGGGEEVVLAPGVPLKSGLGGSIGSVLEEPSRMASWVLSFSGSGVVGRWGVGGCEVESPEPLNSEPCFFSISVAERTEPSTVEEEEEMKKMTTRAAKASRM